MSNSNSGWRNWGDHPIVVLIGLAAGVISIITVLVVKENKPSNPANEQPLSQFSSSSPDRKPEPTSSPVPTFTPQPVSEPVLSTPATNALTFTIRNQLGETQVSEDVQVYIAGRLVAELMVSQQQPVASTEVEVPHPGRYAYTIIADGYFLNQLGQTFRSQGRGDGVIEVREGSTFGPVITPHGIRLLPLED